MDDNYSKLVDAAYELHIAGKLEEAQNIYKKLLTVKPDDINVLNLFAQLNVSVKNYDLALDIFNKLFEKTKLDDILINIAKVHIAKNNYEEAIKSLNSLSQQNISSLRILALAYTKAEKNDEAVKIYENIITATKSNFNDYFNLSVSYSKIKNVEKSLKYAKIAYSINPADIDINLHIASLYESLSMWEEALESLFNITKIVLNKDILYRMGILYKKLDDDQSAVMCFNKILDLDPDNKNALINIASIYKKHDKNVSVKIIKELIEKYPEDISLYSFLYILYLKMMNYQECCNTALKLIELDNNNPFNYSIAGDAYYELYKFDDAVSMYKKAIELNSNFYDNIQIANIYSITGHVEEALEILSKYPENDSARKVYMYIKLREKKLSEIREEYHAYTSKIKTEEEVEENAKSLFYKLNIDQKYKINEDLFGLFKEKVDNSHVQKYEKYSEKDWKNFSGDTKNKRLLIYSANGAGDLIMFCRYLTKIKSIVSEILIQIPASFIDLFKYNFPYVKIYSNKDVISEDSYDISTTFMNLLYNLDIDLNRLDGSSYLSADINLVKQKSSLDIMNTQKKKIGIYWQGNPSILTNRSIKLEKFLPLFDLKDIQIYSFQMSKIDFASEDLKQKLPIIDLEENIKSYSDTAAFLKNIDILISIDTSIANLAGAMGIKTFLLLPFEAEWRWFYDTISTPWYNSVRIFKQVIPGDWDNVILRVKHELSI